MAHLHPQARFVRLAWLLVAALGVVALSLTLYFGITSPVAFQKAASIRFVDSHSTADGPTASEYVDVRSLIGSIPYQPRAQMIYDVDPQRKYRRTIEQGHGNCSNLVFGLAYLLQQLDTPFQIVHLLPRDSFLDGDGHTVVNMPYTIDGHEQYGIVDIVEGGVPVARTRYLTLQSLHEAHSQDVRILPLNGRKDDKSPYYEDFLARSVIGVIEGDEVIAYFKFLDTIYLPLGSPKLEKLLYDAAGVVLGFYPSILVDGDDRDVLFGDHQLTRAAALILLFSVRALLLLGVPLALWQIAQYIRARVRGP